MVEEDAANLIGLILKNISLEAFKGDRNTSDRNASRYVVTLQRTGNSCPHYVRTVIR
jgi:hypothetical protein